MRNNQRGIAHLLPLLVLGVLLVAGVVLVNGLRSKTELRSHAAGGVNIQVNGAKIYQTIQGLGVNANSNQWDNGALEPALTMLNDTAGIQTWRVIVESYHNWEETNDNSDPKTYNWTYYNQLYETPKFVSLWGVLGSLQQKNPGEILLNVMGPVPNWMGGNVINSSAEDEYSEMIASLVIYARNTKHLRIDDLSVMNEEDIGFPEGPSVGAAQYVRILKNIGQRLDAAGLSDIKLAGPETANPCNGTGSYVTAMMADSYILSKLQHFVLHDYGGGTCNADSIISSKAPTKNFWMTEYSYPCSGCDTGSQSSNQWDFAAGSVDQLISYLGQGATSALLYDAYDSFYEHHTSIGYWGMLSYTTNASGTKIYSPRKRFYAMAQAIKYAQPGMTRIDTTSDSGYVHVVAFRNPTTGAFTLFGVNNGTAATLNGTLSGVPNVSSLAFSQTTQSTNMQQGASVPVSNNTFSVSIAGPGVFTLTTLGATTTPSPTASPTPTPTSKAGDFNHDGIVNIADFSQLLIYWNAQNATGDINGDGSVNIGDLSLLLKNWG